MLPYGARPIVEARLQGKRPADMLIVSLVGHVDEVNPVVVADPLKTYDWRFVIGLDVCIFARPGVRFDPVVRELYSHAANIVGVWDVQSQEGADCVVHPTLHAIDAYMPGQCKRFGADDFAVEYTPWLPSQNQEFRGNA